jgi:hypothetical protein
MVRPTRGEVLRDRILERLDEEVPRPSGEVARVLSEPVLLVQEEILQMQKRGVVAYVEDRGRYLGWVRVGGGTDGKTE